MAEARGGADHKKRARLHAIQRAGERYGLLFVHQDVIDHEAMIRYGLSKKLLSSGNSVGFSELHEIEGEFRSYFPVWNPQLGCIVTYLRGPHEWTARARRYA